MQISLRRIEETTNLRGGGGTDVLIADIKTITPIPGDLPPNPQNHLLSLTSQQGNKLQKLREHFCGWKAFGWVVRNGKVGTAGDKSGQSPAHQYFPPPNRRCEVPGPRPHPRPFCVCVPVGVCKLMKLNRLYLMVVRTGEKNSLLVTAGRMANILMERRLK